MDGHRLWVRTANDEMIRADRVVAIRSEVVNRAAPEDWVLRVDVLEGVGTRTVDVCWGAGDTFGDCTPADLAEAITTRLGRAGLLDMMVTARGVRYRGRDHDSPLDSFEVNFEPWDENDRTDTGRTGQAPNGPSDR